MSGHVQSPTGQPEILSHGGSPVKSKNRVILITVALVAVLAAGAGGFLLRGSGDPASGGTPAGTQQSLSPDQQAAVPDQPGGQDQADAPDVEPPAGDAPVAGDGNAPDVPSGSGQGDSGTAGKPKTGSSPKPSAAAGPKTAPPPLDSADGADGPGGVVEGQCSKAGC